MQVTRAALARYSLRLGVAGFGGPVALVAAMHRDLVETRQWYTEAEYRQGVMLAQISPGPLAAQLGFYLAYLRGGVAGAALSAVAFVLPSFLIVVVVGSVYRQVGGLPGIRAVFYGVGAAVTGILVHSGWRLARKTIGRDALLAAIFLALASITAVTGREPVYLIVGAGLVVWITRAPPSWLGRAATVREAGSLFLLAQIVALFTYAGAFVFGSGLAIVPFLHGSLVETRGWLTEAQFLDGVAVALITPGPVVIATAFMGYLVAGLPGAVAAAGATFIPCFLVTLILAPQVERVSRSVGLAAAASGVTAAATGALAGAVLLVGRQSVLDGPTMLIAIGALLSTMLRVPAPVIVVCAGIVGLVR